MGKANGFMEYERKLPEDISPEIRIESFDEFHTHLDPEEQKRQAARCMECGIPFCHTGITLNNMASGCPLNNLIPEWNDLIYIGEYKEAFDRLMATNPFPEATARVCPAPCEGACTNALIGDAVAIKNNEYAIIEKAYEMGWLKPNIPEKRTGKKVAVVGSGPAGLSAAYYLNSYGHEVTVYERDDRVGGLMMYGIPNMKLDKTEILQKRFKIMEKEGIKLVTNTEIGVDLSLDDLNK